jgi:8-oxo-dGTP pyrophosphatase MutT (NUDIX family)
MGFPGGLIKDGEDILSGLNRELFEEMNLDVLKHPVKEDHYVVTHWCPSKKLFLHFYALEVTIDELKVIEEEAIKAHDYGTEVIIQFHLHFMVLVLKQKFAMAIFGNILRLIFQNVNPSRMCV